MTCRQSKTPTKGGNAAYWSRVATLAGKAGNRTQELRAQPNADRLKLKRFSFETPEA